MCYFPLNCGATLNNTTEKVLPAAARWPVSTQTSARPRPPVIPQASKTDLLNARHSEARANGYLVLARGTGLSIGSLIGLGIM